MAAKTDKHLVAADKAINDALFHVNALKNGAKTGGQEVLYSNCHGALLAAHSLLALGTNLIFTDHDDDNLLGDEEDGD